MIRFQENIDGLHDLDNIVSIHIKAFPDFFLSLMGKDFLKEYYRSVLDYADHICIVAKDNNGLIGFVTGFGNPQKFYAHYRSKRKKLIPKTLASLIRRPSLLPRVIQNLKKVSDVSGADSDVELSSIAVHPDSGGSGTGRRLVQLFVESAAAKGFQSIYLTTDRYHNENINRFYLKQDFNLERSFFHGKREMNFFRLDLR